MTSRKQTLLSILEVLSVAFMGVIATVSSWSKWWLVAPALIYAILKYFEYRSGVHDKHLRVHDQLRVLFDLSRFEPEREVRCTYHVPSFHRSLLQVFHYIPTEKGGGRRFPQDKGIIGEAFRQKRFLVENFEDDDEYRRQMKLKYNYTADEVRQRSADRRSYFCYPVMDERHRVLGLIYFDSRMFGTFEHEQPLTNFMVRGCSTISESLI